MEAEREHDAESPPAGDLTANRARSRWQARLDLEAALDARFPRFTPRKPVFAATPLGAY
jgi:hypothetical protein